MNHKSLFLAANTARSQGYAQGLLHNNLKVDDVLILEADTNLPGKTDKSFSNTTAVNTHENIFLPDLRIPLHVTADSIASSVEVIDSNTVNCEKVLNKIQSLKPDLVIYSGYGGEIVSNEILHAAPYYIHSHSGYLPDYRGSTTIYYSILNERKCGVSVITLNEKIDLGQICYKKWYSLPDSTIDVDYLYDVAIRADAMIAVYKNWLIKNKLSIIEKQNSNEGDVYYVIHPLLKHIALLAIK